MTLPTDVLRFALWPPRTLKFMLFYVFSDNSSNSSPDLTFVFAASCTGETLTAISEAAVPLVGAKNATAPDEWGEIEQ